MAIFQKIGIDVKNLAIVWKFGEVIPAKAGIYIN